MADIRSEAMLPYQRTSEYKTRVIEVAALMMEHQDGVTLQQIAGELQTVMDTNIRKLFGARRSPDLVGSKFLYLSTWRECLNWYNPDGVISFPLAQELESQSKNQSLGIFAPSSEYKAYHDGKLFDNRQHEDLTEFEERQYGDLADFETRQHDDLAAFKERQTNDLDLFEQRRSSDRDHFEKRQQIEAKIKIIQRKVIDNIPPPVTTHTPDNDKPQPVSSNTGKGKGRSAEDAIPALVQTAPEASGPEPAPKRQRVSALDDKPMY